MASASHRCAAQGASPQATPKGRRGRGQRRDARRWRRAQPGENHETASARPPPRRSARRRYTLGIPPCPTSRESMTSAEWERLLERSRSEGILVFKHSTACPTSAAALAGLERFLGESAGGAGGGPRARDRGAADFQGDRAAARRAPRIARRRSGSEGRGPRRDLPRSDHRRDAARRPLARLAPRLPNRNDPNQSQWGMNDKGAEDLAIPPPEEFLTIGLPIIGPQIARSAGPRSARPLLERVDAARDALEHSAVAETHSHIFMRFRLAVA